MRLMAECHVLFGAGTETTARTLAVTFYYLMKHHDIAARLRKELTSVLQTTKSTATLPQLERLPYLVSCLLMSCISCHRSPTNNCRPRSSTKVLELLMACRRVSHALPPEKTWFTTSGSSHAAHQSWSPRIFCIRTRKYSPLLLSSSHNDGLTIQNLKSTCSHLVEGAGIASV